MLFGYFLLFAGCSATNTDQYSWILEYIYRDNWRFVSSDPEQLQLKFQAMSDSSYKFMRGTLSLYLANQQRLHLERKSTSFLNSSESTLIPIIGDAHPENVTICALPNHQPTLEFVDLDASDYGRWQ